MSWQINIQNKMKTNLLTRIVAAPILAGTLALSSCAELPQGMIYSYNLHMDSKGKDIADPRITEKGEVPAGAERLTMTYSQNSSFNHFSESNKWEIASPRQIDEIDLRAEKSLQEINPYKEVYLKIPRKNLSGREITLQESLKQELDLIVGGGIDSCFGTSDLKHYFSRINNRTIEATKGDTNIFCELQVKSYGQIKPKDIPYDSRIINFNRTPFSESYYLKFVIGKNPILDLK